MNTKKFHVKIWEVGNNKPIENVHEAKTPQQVIDFFGLREPDVINFDIREVTAGSGFEEDPESEYAPVPVDTYTDKDISAKVTVAFTTFEEGVMAGEDDILDSYTALFTSRFLLSDEQEAAIRILLSHTELLMQEMGDGFPFERFFGFTTALLESIIKGEWKKINEFELNSRTGAAGWLRALKTMSGGKYVKKHSTDESLPPNIVERCDYVGQSLATLDLSEADVDVTKELAVPVKHIRMDYPFPVESGDFNVYRIPEVKTWGELLTETIKVFQREYNAGKNAAQHALEDFVIERVDIHPNNLATVIIGS